MIRLCARMMDDCRCKYAKSYTNAIATQVKLKLKDIALEKITFYESNVTSNISYYLHK